MLVVGIHRLASASGREGTMTGCNDSNTALPESDIDARLGNLVPEVVSLLRRITSA